MNEYAIGIGFIVIDENFGPVTFTTIAVFFDFFTDFVGQFRSI